MPAPRNTKRCATILTAACLSATTPANAINIIMNFDAVGSDSPSFDSDGSLMTALFDYAEDYYQAILEDNTHTLNITFRYDNLNNNLLGQHSYGGAELLFPFRENAATIRIDTTTAGGVTRNWFIDPTPGNDSEFNMNQTLWRDITGTQRADWYNFGVANVPDTFEVGYTGAATAGGGAQGATDMLSVILHEVGHALGMSSANPLTVAQTTDGDYDYNTDFVAGESFGIETANNSGDDNANIAHVESAFALMNPGIPASTRVRPSHSDLFAMATVNLYANNTVDVPRKEFYQNSNWQNPDNWSGHRPPDSGDDVYIRAAQGAGTTLTARLFSANGVADDLFVSEGANFDTDSFKLTVDDDVFVSDPDSDIFINPGGELEADHVVIQNSAEIEMDGGTIDSRRITIDPGTQLEGRTNTITIDVSERLTVNGTLVANNNATMNFTSAAPDAWNLDGSGENDGNGFVNATNGSMNFTNSGMTDGFSATMRIGATRFISFAQSWTLNTGTLDLNGGVDFANRARISGASITNTGGLISASGVSHINPTFIMTGGNIDVFGTGELEFNGAVNISGGDIDILANSVADFDNTVTFSGGNFDVSPTGRIKFDAATSISGGTIDLNGGVDIPNRAYVDGTGTITYSNATVEASGIAHIDNNINIFSGNFTTFIDDELEFNGTANISGGNFTAGNGSLIDFDGPTNLSGSPNFNTAGTEIADGQVRFDGPTTYNGGTIDVVGLARQSGAATVATDTTINADVFDLDGSLAPLWTINKTLTVNADSVETGTSNNVNSNFNINNPGIFLIGSSPGGNLNVNLPGTTEWTLAGTANLDGSSPGGPIFVAIPTMISGSPVNITGTVNTTDRASIAARTDLSGTVNTTAADAIIRLTGGNNTDDPNRIINGSITGPGTLGTTADKAIHGFGNISINTINFPDTSNILADNGVLTISSAITSIGILGTADSDGNLILSLPFNTANADRIELNGGTINGANITNPDGGLIIGHGFIGSNQVINSGDIRADGGTLTLDYNLNPDLDGAGTGTIQAFNGNLTVVDPVTDFFDGVATVGPSRTMTFQQGWTTSGIGTLNLKGGETALTAANVAGLSQSLFGTTNIVNFAAFQLPTTFQGSSNTALPAPTDRLRLQANTTITPGATFAGNGTITNTTGNTLTLLNGANVGVNVENDGTIQIGASPGIADVKQLANLDDGSIVIEVFLPLVPDPKPDPGVDYDQLNVANTLRLNGTLDIDPVALELPLLATEYQVITYGTRAGMFTAALDTIIKPSVALAPLFNDEKGVLTLRATTPGDLNLDEKVSVADLSFFALNFNTAPGLYDESQKLNSWQLGDFNADGRITVADLSLLALNFGFDASDPASTPTPLSLETAATIAGIDLASIPEPTTAATLLLTLTALTQTRPRRQQTQTLPPQHLPTKPQTL